MSYIHFKYVIKLNEFDYSQTWQRRKVNVSNSSMKVKIILFILKTLH
jgi:hypothetical protein